MKILAISIWAALLVTACSSKKAPMGGQLQGGGQGPDINPAACKANDDCVVVQTACCDHCNGGKAEAFNKAFADAQKPKGCANTACTERGCGDATASCDGGLCKVSIGKL